jgi:hypothetical protein
VDTSEVTGSGYRFRYPSYREGLPATLAEIGAAK